MLKMSTLCTLLILGGCTIRPKNDAYEKIAKGTLLSPEIVSQSEQFYFTDVYLVVLFDISDDIEYYSPHLLFFDQSFELVSACYFPSEHIENIENQTITCRVNPDRVGRTGRYRNDFPDSFQLNLLPASDVLWSGYTKNKVIDSLDYEASSQTLTLYSRRSDGDYGARRLPSFPDVKINSEIFVHGEVLTYNISTLNFNFKKGLISTLTLDSEGGLIWDHMLVSIHAKTQLDQVVAELGPG
jgi:hypothetical protein